MEIWNELGVRGNVHRRLPGDDGGCSVWAKALEELAPDVGSLRKVGVRTVGQIRRRSRTVKLVVSGSEPDARKIGDGGARGCGRADEAGNEASVEYRAYVRGANGSAFPRQRSRRQGDAKDLWTCESIGTRDPGRYRRGAGSCLQLVRHTSTGCGVVKMRAGPKMGRPVYDDPAACVASERDEKARRGTMRSSRSWRRRSSASTKTQDRLTARRSRLRGTVAYSGGNQREKVWPGIVAWELRRCGNGATVSDDETKLGGLSRKDWMIDYSGEGIGRHGKAPLPVIGSRGVGQNWRGARRLKQRRVPLALPHAHRAR